MLEEVPLSGLEGGLVGVENSNWKMRQKWTQNGVWGRIGIFDAKTDVMILISKLYKDL